MARKHGKDRGIVEKPKGSGKWWVRLHVHGREKVYRADNKSQAKALYGRLKSELREGTYFPEKYKRQVQITLRALIKEYVIGCTNRGVLNEKRYGRCWSLWLGARPIRELTTDELRKWQSKLRAKMKPMKGGQPPARQWSDATINRHFGFLRRVLNIAFKDSKLNRNPVSGINFFPESNQTRFLDEGEIGRLQGLMAAEDWKLVVFAIETGLRRSEQFGLLWKYVNLEAGVLTIPLPKGGKTRHVPLSEGAKAVLRSLPSFLESAYVFPKPDNWGAMDSRAFMRRAYTPALRKAGIQGATWHTLRHTAASRRVMAGVDIVSVKEIMGHRNIETTLRYSHLSPQHLREAVNRGSLSATGSKTGSGLDIQGCAQTQAVELTGAPGAN
jgi:integrase